ncbi:hypothetical protein HYDPIDRAFT_112894, partial [Hydnomerulius pinastri MD-312]
MSGPHVFSFANDGTVVPPKTSRPSPYPSFFARQPLRSTNRDQYDLVSASGATASKSVAPSATRSYAEAVKASLSNNFCDVQKPWKNVAITEHDDAEFEAIMAAEEQKKEELQQELEEENEKEKKAKQAKLVYAWPPAMSSYFEVLEPAEEVDGGSVDENSAPELSYSVSASQESENEESAVIPSPKNRVDRVPFHILHEKPVLFEDEALERVVGFERLRRKAPPPLRLDIDLEDNECFLFGNRAERSEERDLATAKWVGATLHYHLRL